MLPFKNNNNVGLPLLDKATVVAGEKERYNQYLKNDVNYKFILQYLSPPSSIGTKYISPENSLMVSYSTKGLITTK